MRINNKSYDKHQSGFTLVELMISIVLGLLITAAAIQLFTGGLITTRLQQANAELQDSGIFGIDYLVRDIRLANYGNALNLNINDTTAWGGIVLTTTTSTTTAVNLPAKVTASTLIPQGLLTHSEGTNEAVSTTGNEWKGLSNVTQKSDQLTIQFIAPAPMTNCEGSNVQINDLVVQRYFIRRDTTGSTTDYALACDANDPVPAGSPATPRPTLVTGLGGAGEIIIPRVDHFHILLGAQNASGNIAYYTVNQYRTAVNTARTALLVPPRIISVKLSVLVRSADNTNSNSVVPNKSFTMLDQTVTPNNTTRFARQVYSTSIALRNALGENP
jgi:type IV pilus assembly protein PilW